jgi:hypothetical protein
MDTVKKFLLIGVVAIVAVGLFNKFAPASVKSWLA